MRRKSFGLAASCLLWTLASIGVALADDALKPLDLAAIGDKAAVATIEPPQEFPVLRCNDPMVRGADATNHLLVPAPQRSGR